MARALVKKVNVPKDDTFAGYMKQIQDLTKILESLGSGHPLPKMLQRWVDDPSIPVTDRMMQSAQIQIRQLGREIKAMWQVTGEGLGEFDYITMVRDYIQEQLAYWSNAGVHVSDFTNEAIRFYTDALKILNDAVAQDRKSVNIRIGNNQGDVLDYLDIENFQDTDGVYDSSDLAKFELIVTGKNTTKERMIERDMMQGIYDEE